MDVGRPDLRNLPSVDEVLRTVEASLAIERFGRPLVVAAVRAALDERRAATRTGEVEHHPTAASVAQSASHRLEERSRPSLRPVLNLTGTVLHTNLGRAQLPEQAAAAALKAIREAIPLEFDLNTGRRGERDDHLRDLLRELTGAENATVVNNNAAAVLLVLNTFASGRETVVSRGELIEIGGSFRLPEIMARAGARLVEVGTTNRTHLKDYAAAIGPATGLLLKVHTSNYRIEGFTAAVSPHALHVLARERGVPLVHDLGSGTLVSLERWGLKHEPTVAEAIAAGADLVTFSGDKLLGGPQAGVIVGRRALVAEVNRNPMKRALRIDKVRLACLEATLRLYRDPDRLAERLPTLRFLSRPVAEILAAAGRLAPNVAAVLGEAFVVEVVPCRSEIGSGALPLERIDSAALAIRSVERRGAGGRLEALSGALRRLPMPVIGRIERQTLLLDLRCLDDESCFVANLGALDLRRCRGPAPSQPPGDAS